MYGDKKASMQRFSERYIDLDKNIKKRLVIENDDRSYNIGDVLDLSYNLSIPVVYDNLHNKINSCGSLEDDAYWINKCRHTWKENDGIQKVHYSQQDETKSIGSHSKTIDINKFMSYYESLGEYKPDIMLEVKDKNLSAVKCINCTNTKGKIKVLEDEWSRYKYLILEKSQNDYNRIRNILKDKTSYPAIEFYRTIENTLSHENISGNFINATLHVWGYFKNKANDNEAKHFFKLMQHSQEMSIKRYLYKLAEKYKENYLLSSYYFL